MAGTERTVTQPESGGNAGRKLKKLNRNPIAFTIISTVILTVYSLVIILPLIWAFYSSFKSELDFGFNPLGLPKEIFGGWQFENYAAAFRVLYIAVDTPDGGTRYVMFAELFLNTVIYAAGCTVVATYSHVIVSYIVSRYSFGFGKFIYRLVIVVMALPIVGSLPSELQMAQMLGVYDNKIAIWIMKGGFSTMYFLILCATFGGIPKEYSEAAQIDGAGHALTCIKIIVPMAKNTIIAIMLLFFIQYWNDYYTPMMFLPGSPTISYGLYWMQFSYRPEITTPIIFVGSIVVCLPVFVVYMIFRNRIMGAVMIGGIKA